MCRFNLILAEFNHQSFLKSKHTQLKFLTSFIMKNSIEHFQIKLKVGHNYFIFYHIITCFLLFFMILDKGSFGNIIWTHVHVLTQLGRK